MRDMRRAPGHPGRGRSTLLESSGRDRGRSTPCRPLASAIGTLSRLRGRASRRARSRDRSSFPRRASTSGRPPLCADHVPSGRILPSDPVVRTSLLGWLPALACSPPRSASWPSSMRTPSLPLGPQWRRADVLAGLWSSSCPWRVSGSASDTATRTERVASSLAGVALYLVKVVHSPFDFTFSDELIHAHNAEILADPPPLLCETDLSLHPDYPGLEATTAALGSFSGLRASRRGLLVVGTARLVLALVFLFDRRSAARRAVAAAPLFHAGCVELPLLERPVFVRVACVTSRRARGAAPRAGSRKRGDFADGMGIDDRDPDLGHRDDAPPKLVRGRSLPRRCSASPPEPQSGRSRPRSLWPFMLFATFAVGVWLAFVARETVGYLTPVFSRLSKAAVDTVSREAPTRTLFTSDLGIQSPF